MVPRVIAALLAAAALVPPGQASDNASRETSCSSSVEASGSFVDAGVECGLDGHNNEQPTTHHTSGKPFYTAYRWKAACGDKLDDHVTKPCPTDVDWCPDGERLFWLQGLHDGRWYDLGRRCAAIEPTMEDAAELVTPGMVLREFERVPLPRLRSLTQPADTTLVNLATIFHVEAEPLRRTLTLAGQRVDLDITPASFHWVHGDGTDSTTRTPGAAYPSREVTHRYQRAHVTVRHHVEVTWSARWRLNGGPWQDVPGTVTVSGPATALRVVEATPVLSGDGH